MPYAQRIVAVGVVVSLLTARAGFALADEPSFLLDVMPILAKAGCNAGTCHGNAGGKGGFKLSLRGQYPAADYRALTRQHSGRRVDLVSPADSLLLRKPTMQLAHEGGRRFADDSWEYNVLRDWLAVGAPGPNVNDAKLTKLVVSASGEEFSSSARVIVEPQTSIQLHAVAQFSDGTQRDVTPIAVYEVSNTLAHVSPAGLVQTSGPGETTVIVRFLDRQVAVALAQVPARPDFAWANPPARNYIDEHVFTKLRALRMNPSDVCDDHVFLRRASIDLLGIPPTAEDAREFVEDQDADKRARLIDELLQRPEFAEVWALRWSDILRNEEKTLDQKGVTVFHAWLRDSFAEGKPLDKFARELIASRGSTYKNPPANYWRAMRDATTRSEATARLLLGVRLQCAKCHNHPFDRWTQDDYYSWAALFTRIDYEIVGKNERKDKLDKHEFNGEQVVTIKSDGEIKNPTTGRDAPPKFLGAPAPDLKPKEDRLQPLADWIADKQNKQFARAQVNRIWYYLMGRGLVEPIDDFRATNPPTHPDLLEALADDFIAGDFNVRRLVRTIMLSRTYQLASRTNATNATDGINYSHNIPRRLTAEQLLDAQCLALGASAKFNGYPAGTRAGQIAGVERVRARDERPADGDRFLKVFGRPMRLLSCECERTNEPNLRQALTLVADESVQGRLADEGNRLHAWATSDRSNSDVLDELYWTAISRPPSEAERQGAERMLNETDDRFVALQDIAWAVMNSSEFLLRH